MPSTMDHVQQLTGSQLDLLCHNYNVVERQPMERRHLERRLHVAIVAERARWRARHLLYNFNDDQQSYFGNLWSQNDRMRDTYNHVLFSGYHNVHFSTPRPSGGDELKLELEGMPEAIEDVDEQNGDQNDDYDEDVDERTVDEEDDDEQLELEYEQYQRMEYERQQIYESRRHIMQQEQELQLHSDMEQHSELEPEQQQQQQQFDNDPLPQQGKPSFKYGYPIPLYFQQQFQHRIHSPSDEQAQLRLLQQQDRISNIALAEKPSVSSSSAEYYSESSTSQVTATEYLTLSSSNKLDHRTHDVGIDHVPEHPLHEAESFMCCGEPKTSSFTNLEPEPEPEVSSERVLCTIHYLNVNSVNQDEHQKYKSDEIIQDLNSYGDRRICGPYSNRRRRPHFWRFMLATLTRATRRFTFKKLQYSIIGCSIIVSIYIGIKMLQ